MPKPTDATLLLVDFLNTLDVESGTDILTEPDGFDRWARDHGCLPGRLEAARTLRAVLRSSLVGEQPEPPGTVLSVGFDENGAPRLGTTTVVEAALAAAVQLATVGQWHRLKLCPADECLEAFFDASRNGSRVWCDMADCGNAAKVRRFRTKPVSG